MIGDAGREGRSGRGGPELERWAGGAEVGRSCRGSRERQGSKGRSWSSMAIGRVIAAMERYCTTNERVSYDASDAAGVMLDDVDMGVARRRSCRRTTTTQSGRASVMINGVIVVIEQRRKRGE